MLNPMLRERVLDFRCESFDKHKSDLIKIVFDDDDDVLWMNFHLQLNEHRRREEIIQEIFFWLTPATALTIN